MPELPDVLVYQEALQRFVVGQRVIDVRMPSVSLVRTYDPPIEAVTNKRVLGIERLGKRLVLAFEDELYLVLHLMIAGRLKWRAPGAKIPRKYAHGALDFAGGTLLITEMGSKKRASLHVVQGREALEEHTPGGLDLFAIDAQTFGAMLTRENHTLKRALTDPRAFDGIGNAYSDEILHAACLSPLTWTQRLTREETARLFSACQETLTRWTERLRTDVGEGFPEKVTAFREGMAVHGRYREPCPRCGDPVQRIVHATNETNYCATCQTEGKVYADRALSRLLRHDWPRRLEDWEALRRPPGGP